jgi:hypothetical protein
MYIHCTSFSVKFVEACVKLEKKCRLDDEGGIDDIFAIYCCIPDTVENIAVGEDSYVDVWNEDIMEPSLFFVPEESVRHPHLLGIRHSEVLDFG